MAPMRDAMSPTARRAQEILVVEDSLTDFLLIEDSVSRGGWRNPIVRASDGQEAVDRLSDAAVPLPGLVLLDLNLPRLSGFEVLAWMRTNPRTRRTPVVVLTTSELVDDVNKAYAAGANSFVHKPVDPEGLHDAFGRLVGYWLELVVLPEETMEDG